MTSPENTFLGLQQFRQEEGKMFSQEKIVKVSMADVPFGGQT